ncbi:LysR family transcriptional regulator [Umezawaea endophytica]|jgi:DNA-binding transcriptional LysR family regulator|uniref:LysR family transcriptional regulator n=1 Tax=Umezawaea endophytica TaxID=1654476 RepID=A0A9X2VGK2_9PSEU|nr:LysR family transcriptional regulator [Umezawaea endophytica]MCS7476226.1 LysR family transcriptional regulator [Umezawaea endophytica]HWO59008.1 LysR family transcriptional regulator [Umezawaea sp.]
METRQLLAFTTVVQTGSFTKAAATLNCSQPTITTRIKALEETLGVSLFRRLPRGIQMTSAGVELLPFARNIITLTDKARKAITMNGEPHGKLVIGSAQSLTDYRLLPLIEYMCWRYPSVQISLHSRNTQSNLSSVREGRLDCAFFIGPIEPREGLESTVLCPEPLVMVSGPTHALTRRSVITEDELRGSTLVRAENGASYYEQFEQALGLHDSESRSPVLALDSIDAAKRAVASGLGISLVPEVTVAAELADGRLRRLPWVPPFRVYTQFAWRQDNSGNPSVTALVSAAAQVVSEQVATPA